jgi:tripartite motif-containing protein 71
MPAILPIYVTPHTNRTPPHAPDTANSQPNTRSELSTTKLSPGVHTARWRGWLATCACVLSLGTLAGCGSSGDPAGVIRGDAVGGFGKYGKGAGELFEPNGIAVNQQTGDIFVVDSNNARIDKFTSNGTFLYAFGWGAIDGKTRALQRCTTKCSLGIEGPGEGQFQFPEGIAVDNNPSSPSHGDLYVVDIGNHRIQKFTPTGHFLLTIGNGVNDVAHAQGYPTIENRCPVNLGDICGPGSERPSQAPADSQLEFSVEGDFIAVGPNGTLYIGQRNSVKEFTPEGIYKAQIKLTPIPSTTKDKEAGGVSGLAVNTTGDIYVIRHGITGVNEYTPAGKHIQTLEQNTPPATPEGPTPALTLDTNNNIYIDIHTQQQHHIDEYTPTGIKLATLDQNQPDGLHGLAYNQQTNKLYIINTNAQPLTAHIRTTTPPHHP